MIGELFLAFLVGAAVVVAKLVEVHLYLTNTRGYGIERAARRLVAAVERKERDR